MMGTLPLWPHLNLVTSQRPPRYHHVDGSTHEPERDTCPPAMSSAATAEAGAAKGHGFTWSGDVGGASTLRFECRSSVWENSSSPSLEPSRL